VYSTAFIYIRLLLFIFLKIVSSSLLFTEVEMAEIPSDSVQGDVKLADIVNCSVCSGLLNDAKLLPCSHSYCLGCLDGIIREQINNGETGQLACPRCKSNFSIPTGGLQNLPQNVYVDDLVQLKELSMPDRPGSGSGDERDPTDGHAGELSLIRTYRAQIYILSVNRMFVLLRTLEYVSYVKRTLS